MRKTLFTLALGCLLTCGAGVPAAHAQEGGGYQGRHGHGRMDPDRQLERLTRELNLTADQQAQIKPILVDRQQKVEALMQDQSLSDQDRRTRMRGVADEARTRIRSWLNDGQKQKYDQMQEQMHDRMMQHRGGDAPQPQ